MESLSLLEKLQVLFQNVLVHPIFILILLIPAFLILFNKKITKKLLVIIYILVLSVVLFVGNDVIFKLFDNVVNGIFMTLYFPNFVTLFIVEMLSAIIMLITFLKEITKLSKRINIIAFSLIQGLFCLVLTVIKANKIDIYKENALYSNSDVLTLMQLLMGVFLLQMLSLLVIYVVEKITNKLDEKDKPKIEKENVHIITPYAEKKIKLEKQKPLDKNLILDKHITPADLRQTIKEEEQTKLEKIKPSVPLDKTLILDNHISSDDLKGKVETERQKVSKPQNPLDKSLIIDNVIEASDLKEEIEKQNQKINEMNKPQSPLDKTLILDENMSSEDLMTKIKEDEQIKLNQIKPQTPLDKKLIINKNITSMPVLDNTKKEMPENKAISFADFKPEFPDAKTKAVEIKTPPLEELSIKLSNKEPVKDTPKELIGNITIVNFDKTVKLIKELKRVYTF